jgi:predicted acetyltransferase
MNMTIRQTQGEEMLNSLYELNKYSLHPSPPFMDKEEWMGRVRERKGVTCYTVFEDSTPVANVVSTAMTQNMRGKLFPASGVWGVSTHPSVRRKGYCRQAMASLLAAERESGKVFSNLYPFRESFYERLGYVGYPLTKIAKIAPSDLAPLLKLELGSEIELKLIGEGFDEYREYLAKMRLQRHGMAFFDIGDRAAANRNYQWMAFARFDGKIEGLMMYRLEGEEVGKFKFTAYRFYYRSSRARYLMLNWIARHVDQADRAELWLAPDEYPETWLSDLQVKGEVAIRPAMCRVLDVEKMGGMSVGKGGFAAKIIDPLCPWNEGVWHFGEHDGKLKVSKASIPDCEMTIQGLGALVTGTRDAEDLALRWSSAEPAQRWSNAEPALQSIQRDLFPRMTPYLHENF